MTFGTIMKRLAESVAGTCNVDAVLREAENQLRFAYEHGWIPGPHREEWLGLLNDVREQLDLPAYATSPADEGIDLAALEAECRSTEAQMWGMVDPPGT